MSHKLEEGVLKRLLYKSSATAEGQDVAFDAEIQKIVTNLGNFKDLVQNSPTAVDIADKIKATPGLNQIVLQDIERGGQTSPLMQAAGNIWDNKDYLAAVHAEVLTDPLPADIAAALAAVEAKSPIHDDIEPIVRETLSPLIEGQKAANEKRKTELLSALDNMEKGLDVADESTLRKNLRNTAYDGYSSVDLKSTIQATRAQIIAGDLSAAADLEPVKKAINDALPEGWDMVAVHLGNAVEGMGGMAVGFVEWTTDDPQSPLAKTVRHTVGAGVGILQETPGLLKDTYNKVSSTPDGKTAISIVGALLGSALGMAVAGNKILESKFLGKIGTWPFIGALVKLGVFVAGALGIYKGLNVAQGSGTHIRTASADMPERRQITGHDGGVLRTEIAAATPEQKAAIEARQAMGAQMTAQTSTGGKNFVAPQMLNTPDGVVASGGEKNYLMADYMASRPAEIRALPYDAHINDTPVLATIGFDQSGNRTFRVPMPEMGLGVA